MAARRFFPRSLAVTKNRIVLSENEIVSSRRGMAGVTGGGIGHCWRRRFKVEISVARAVTIRGRFFAHFRRLGLGTMDCITNWRITKANNLIRYSRLPIVRIAESMGFSTARTLNKDFQRRHGLTPDEIKRTSSERQIFKQLSVTILDCSS